MLNNLFAGGQNKLTGVPPPVQQVPVLGSGGEVLRHIRIYEVSEYFSPNQIIPPVIPLR